METSYVYIKPRHRFGKRCYFSERDKLEVDIKSDPSLGQDYVRIDPIDKATQYSKVFAAHEVNTVTATFKSSGMFHQEGGWPKDINRFDPEQTQRYRRKIEKDEPYIHAMHQLLPQMEHCVLQNNASNIYQQYFEDIGTSYVDIQSNSCRTVNVYRDPLPIKRPVTHVSWSPDQGSRIAVSHCCKDFKKPPNSSPDSYIWDVENPNKPVVTLKPYCPLLSLEYNSKDSNLLVSGLTSGQVAFWDVRRSFKPSDMSDTETSHRDPCDNVLWINAKSGAEFFSSSRDGQVKWWDCRKLSSPVETLIMDLVKPDEQDLDRATGVCSLQFEPSIGTRFMCGLENGTVIAGNRKGKTPAEKLAVRFTGQIGPVINVERNPTFLKNFLTIGDWAARIWSEDCKEACIMWTPADDILLTAGNWSATRYSVFFITKNDGTMDIWDLLMRHDNSVLSTKVCDDPLACIKPHEAGKLVATGSKNGAVFLMEVSENLTTNQKNDKLLLTALFDREARRERVIEAKNRELRLKAKARVDSTEEVTSLTKMSDNLRDPAIEQAEQEYEAALKLELERQSNIDDSFADFLKESPNIERTKSS